MDRKTRSSATATLLLAILGAPTAPGQNVIEEFKALNPQTFLGAEVSLAGDVNADGVPDLIVCAGDSNYPATSIGQIYLYSGADGSLLFSDAGTVAHQRVGWDAAGMGDIDGDGHDDFAYSNTTQDGIFIDQGLVKLVSGKTFTPIWSVDGQETSEWLGSVMDNAGDWNADGDDDVLVTAIGTANHSGSVRVLSGSDGSLLFQLVGGPLEKNFGWDAAPAGDVDADGHADILFSDYGNNQVWVASGKTGNILHRLTSTSGAFGIGLSGIGDVNSDGHDDFAVGASWEDAPFVNSGVVYVYSGLDGSLLYQRAGWQAHEHYGSEIAPVGDMDLDGKLDFAVSATGYKLDGVEIGAVRILSGQNGSLLYSLCGSPGGTGFGRSVACLGDLTQDGRPEVIVGEPYYFGIASLGGRARIFSPGTCTGDVVSAGSGCAGPGGFTPVLKVTGCPTSYEEVLVEIEDVIGQETALLLLGVQPAWLSLNSSCTLQLAPVGPLIFLPVFGAQAPGQGFTKVSGHLPSIPTTIELKMQALVTDASSPGGAVISNLIDNGDAVDTVVDHRRRRTRCQSRSVILRLTAPSSLLARPPGRWKSDTDRYIPAAIPSTMASATLRW